MSPVRKPKYGFAEDRVSRRRASVIGRASRAGHGAGGVLDGDRGSPSLLTLRKRLRIDVPVGIRNDKNPAAVALGSRGGMAGTGAAKRRGDADYYRALVARRLDRNMDGTSMSHRHLTHREFTLAAIDDVIGRGRRAAWEALRRKVLNDPGMLPKVLRVCSAHTSDPYAQRYHFWQHYAQTHQTAS